MRQPHDDPGVERYAVIVIGGGPTGLTLANLLSRYGTRALLVERNATTVQEPRAVSIDDESLRTMQAAGMIDAVLPGIVSGYGSEYLSPRGRIFMRALPSARPYGYARRNAFRQPRLEADLRHALDGSATVNTLFGHELLGFEQDDGGVRVEIGGPDGRRRTMRCDYLVGADGARSPVRNALGLTLDGETFEEKWLIVDLEDSPAPSRETIVFCDARRPCIALPGPDQTRRFEFKLRRGETPEDVVDDGHVRRLLAAHGAHPDSRIGRKVVYTFHARLAPRWSQGRVFLAGDACHLTPPFAGQGMNSGIRDAHNLAWKLACVTAGTLPPSLLDSYETERRTHVGEMIRLALRMGRIMGPRSMAHGLATRAVFRTLGLWPVARDYLAEMKYKPKPRFARGFVLPDGRSAHITPVGRLVPQPQVDRPDGQPVLFDEVLGDGFALVGFGETGEALARIAGMPAFAAFRPALVRIGEAHGAGDPRMQVVRDVTGTVRAVAGGDDWMLLVRPDRYVLAAFRQHEAVAVARRLATLGVGISQPPPTHSEFLQSQRLLHDIPVFQELS